MAYLKEAAAEALDCPLVTLHSRKWTSAYHAAVNLDSLVDLIAIDVPAESALRGRGRGQHGERRPFLGAAGQGEAGLAALDGEAAVELAGVCTASV